MYSSTLFTVLSRAGLVEKRDSAETCDMMMPRSSGGNAASLRGNSIVQQNRRGHVEDENGNSELGAETRTLFLYATMQRFLEFSTFGPPSRVIRIPELLDAAKESQNRVSPVLDVLNGDAMPVDDENDLAADFEPIPADLKAIIEEECR